MSSSYRKDKLLSILNGPDTPTEPMNSVPTKGTPAAAPIERGLMNSVPTKGVTLDATSGTGLINSTPTEE
jgi:hypothetical protein